MRVSWITVAIVAIVAGLIIKSPAIFLLSIAVSGIAVFRLSNRFELSVSFLLIGTTVVGTIGIYIGVGFLAKLCGLASLFFLRNSIVSLRNHLDILFVLFLSFALCVIFYYLGPQTPVTKSKLTGIMFHSFFSLIAINALMNRASVIRFDRLGLIFIWFVACYVAFISIYELNASGVNILSISGIRAARAALIGELIEEYGYQMFATASYVNYQLVGNAAAIGLTFIGIHFLSKNKNQFDFSWMLVCALGLLFVVISGSRQSLILLVIALSSFLLIKNNIRKRLVGMVVLAALAGLVSVVVIGYLAEVPFIVAMIDNDKGLASVMNRDTNFNAAVYLIEQKPWLGWGLGGYHIPELRVQPGEHRFFPHNVILELWSEMGLIGMIAFLGSWIILYYQSTHLKQNKKLTDIYLPGGYSLLPLLIFFLTTAMMNEILTRAMSMFILVAFYLAVANKENLYVKKEYDFDDE